MNGRTGGRIHAAAPGAPPGGGGNKIESASLPPRAWAICVIMAFIWAGFII
eukprot:CAMPEP_0178584860 /NCGR_PEP_ID=MMETSP0697-20121206/25073_1 /TAXON_ID=265572 /ORGANISM="Extubocellulus spinifer, Strain CCMP396" /LENGTH=50 /DNA_ID=CAMNT_0020220867 /DNA_START=65 /DNA_END=217 /DNA_ORIENTATION=-